MARKRGAEVVSDKSVNIEWGEGAAKIVEIDIWRNQIKVTPQKNDKLAKQIDKNFKQQESKYANGTNRDSPMFDIELDEADDIGNTVTGLIESLEEPTSRKHLEEFVILSLSEEVGNVVKLLRNQISMKDETIKTLSSETKMNQAEIDNLRNQSQDMSQKNDELTKTLEEACGTNHELETKLEVAKDELSSVKSEKDKWEEEMTIKEEMINCLANEVNLTKQELFKTKAASEKRHVLLAGLEEVRTEEARRLQNLIGIVKKITDDKTRVESEHENCKKESESLNQKMALQHKKIESFNDEQKWSSEKQKENLKLSAEKSESKMLAYLGQINLLKEEKEGLSEKNCKYEKEIGSLKMRCNEANKSSEEQVLSKQKLIEEKLNENSELRTQVEDLKKKIGDKNAAIEISQNENCTNASKFTNLCKKVKVTEEKLALNNSRNLELTSKLDEISEKVKVCEKLVKEKEVEISRQVSDVDWYKTQAKGFSNANRNLQKQLIEVHEKLLQAKEKKTLKRTPEFIDLSLLPDKELEDGELEGDKASTSRRTVERQSGRKPRGEFCKMPSSPVDLERSRQSGEKVELNFPELLVYDVIFKCGHCGVRFTNGTALNNHTIKCKNYENGNRMNESEQDSISQFDIAML